MSLMSAARAQSDTAIPTLCDASPAFVRDDLLPLLAQALDAKRYDVSDLEPLRTRLHTERDAGRSAGRDHVAGNKCHVTRQVRHELRDAEDHRPRITGLAALAIDVEPHVEILRILDLVGRHQPRTHRSERVAPFALAPLRSATLQLE